MKKRYIVLVVIFCIICIRSYLVFDMKNSKVNVENHICTLNDLLKMNHTLRHYVYDDFTNTLFNSEITGISSESAGVFRYSNLMPIYLENMDDTPLSSNVSSKFKPMLRYIELYDYKGDLYVKVYYSTDRDYGGYYAVYMYSEDSEQALREFLENKYEGY